MIIDSHAHIARVKGLHTEGKSWDEILKLLLAEMKSSEVDHALILSDAGGLDEGSFPQTGTVLKTVGNTERVSVVGSINPTNYTKENLDELEVWFRTKKIVAVKLYPGYQSFYPNEERCAPIYKLCIKYDVPVIFHSGDTLSTDEKVTKIKYSQPIHIDDVASDFLDLKIVIAHMGNPWLIDCAEVLYKNPNVYADMSGMVVGESLKSPYGKIMKQKIQELIAYASPRKLLYGTDWPLAPMKDYIKFVKRLGFSKQDLEYVFYKNAKEIFKI